jgi:formylglycine-generating enzyme required for sulfatase activity
LTVSHKTRKSLSVSFFLVISIVLLINFQQTVQAQEQDFSLDRIIKFLSAASSNLEGRNKLLIEKINEGNVKFSLTREIEQKLRDKGAKNELIEVIRKKSLPSRVNSNGMTFTWIPEGQFEMGGLKNDNEKPIHTVIFKDGFWMGRYEVTISEWKNVMGKIPEGMIEEVAISPGYTYKLELKFKESSFQPVLLISWDDAAKFIEKLNAQDKVFKYSLPSEAQWEYACRAGKKTEYFFGDHLNAKGYANYKDIEYSPNPTGESFWGKTREVGSYPPNDWGLYDMHGNVAEWCQDVYFSDYAFDSLPTDGSPNLNIGGKKEIQRVYRGGSWSDTSSNIRSAYRVGSSEFERSDKIGLRLVARLR